MLEGRLLLDSKRPSAIDKCLSISEVIEGGLEAYFHRPPRLDYLSSKVLEFIHPAGKQMLIHQV